jgi:hypothetical protein
MGMNAWADEPLTRGEYEQRHLELQKQVDALNSKLWAVLVTNLMMLGGVVAVLLHL